MKDGTKTLSERATRFLPVDMKDRLKSAFNRTSNTTSENAPADDAPDYSAIFNSNRSSAGEKRTPFPVGGPVDQTQPGETSGSVTTKNPARQIAQDIEEAEIVVEPSDEPAARPEWEAASLKTRKAEAFVDTRRSPATPEIEDVPDSSATFKNNKSRTAQINLARRNPEASELKPVFKEEVKPASKEDSRPRPELKARDDTSVHEEAVAQKPKSRFFGDFASTESVRLKIEKRNEKRSAAAPTSSSGARHAQPELRPAEVNAHGTEGRMAAGFAFEAEPLEPSDAYRGTTEAVALGSATSERANVSLQEEYDSMDTKGLESGNGATVGTDGSSSVAAIVIERNSKFSGQLKFSGAITIEGHVEGELIAERIVVHEGGVVNATVEGDTVVIAGTVKGDISAHSELEILASGVVDGSVTAPAITVRRGGRVEGRCAIGVPRQ